MYVREAIDMNQENIGNRLKSLRLQHKLTQEEVGQKINVSKQTLYKYETGIITNIPSDKIELLATIYDVSPAYLMGWESSNNHPVVPSPRKGIRIPVLGRVVAGIPIEAITDILDWEEIDPELAKTGEFFALQVQGASMEPKLYDGDVVIVRRQSTVESGETAIILVNGNDATVKQVKEVDAGIMLIGHNTAVYEPHFYSQQEISDLPVQILGKVVELRRKF
jgi:repressor LexA